MMRWTIRKPIDRSLGNGGKRLYWRTSQADIEVPLHGTGGNYRSYGKSGKNKSTLGGKGQIGKHHRKLAQVIFVQQQNL